MKVPLSVNSHSCVTLLAAGSMEIAWPKDIPIGLLVAGIGFAPPPSSGPVCVPFMT